MADIINNIGSGQTYPTVAVWWADRPNDGNRWVGNYVDTNTFSVGELSGTNNGGAELRADASVAYDFESPTNPHPIISSSVAPIYIRATDKFILRGFELTSTGTSAASALVRCGSFEDCDVEVHSCRLKGGFEGVGTSRAGAKIHLDNCAISGCREFGIRGNSIGVTATHVVVYDCNQVASNFRAGIQTKAGAVYDSVVSYNNTSKDWIDSNATAINCASGDNTASFSSNAVIGVVDADFENIGSDIWTATAGGALEGTGSGSSDIGLSLVAIDSISIISPSEQELIQRDLPANTADIIITGTYTGTTVPTSIEASFNGGAFQTIAASPTEGTYTGTLTGQPAGNGDLIVRFSNEITINSVQSNVAIGAKYLFWGQSNFSGRATNPQTYTGIVGFYHKYTVDNNSWDDGNEPFDKDTAAGSLFPILANLLVQQLGIPVGFIGVAEGSTTLAQWQPGQTLNTRMLDYITSSGGSNIEGVASWIGESDAAAVTDETTFKNGYNVVINQLKTLTGIDSVLCGTAMAGTPSDNVRQWIQDIVSTNASAIRYVDMSLEFSGIHYETNFETEDAATALSQGLISAYYTTTVSLTGTDTPDGTYPMHVINDASGTEVETVDLTFSGGDATYSSTIPVGTKLWFLTKGDNPPTTGLAYIGDTV